MNILLPAELENFVQERIASGRSRSAEEVIAAGLRLLQEQDENALTALEELRAKIAVGMEQAERGGLVDGPAAFAKLRRRLGPKG
jgi:antitoxin ParD1/3/4